MGSALIITGIVYLNIENMVVTLTQDTYKFLLLYVWQNAHSLHQISIQFYCHSLQIHLISMYLSPVYQMLNVTQLVGFYKAFCWPSKDTTLPMKGVN